MGGREDAPSPFAIATLRSSQEADILDSGSPGSTGPALPAVGNREE